MAETQAAQDTPARPSGPVNSVDDAAKGIDGWLAQQSEPLSEAQEANEQANPEPPAKAAEEADDEPQESAREAEAEPEKEEAEAEPQEQESEQDETVEVAETLDGLANQLGVDAKDFMNHVKVQAKIDGQVKTVTLGEAVAGFQLESKYRQNTQALAAERKTFEQERESFQAERQQSAQMIATLAQEAERAIVGEEKSIDPALQETDPDRYMLLREQARDRRDQLAALHNGLARIQQQLADEQADQQRTFVSEQANKLAELVPEWGADPGEGKKQLAQLRDWAMETYGYSREEADLMYDARTILAFRDLKRLKDLETKVPTMRKKLHKLPKTVKAGAGRDAKDQQRDKATASLKRARKSQNMGDFAQALMDRGVV